MWPTLKFPWKIEREKIGKKKWPKIFIESQERPRDEKGIGTKAVWQTREFQVEEQDVPNPKKKKVLDLVKELK